MEMRWKIAQSQSSRLHFAVSSPCDGHCLSKLLSVYSGSPGPFPGSPTTSLHCAGMRVLDPHLKALALYYEGISEPQDQGTM